MKILTNEQYDEWVRPEMMLGPKEFAIEIEFRHVFDVQILKVFVLDAENRYFFNFDLRYQAYPEDAAPSFETLKERH